MSDLVTQLSSVFLSPDGLALKDKMNQMLKTLIDNDISMTVENSVAPGLWECRWLNDKNASSGYGKGQAVWLNTDTASDVVASRFSQISAYIAGNSVLNRRFQNVNRDDPSAVSKFFAQAATGEVDSSVSAIYFLGDIKEKARIRVSLSADNRSYPDDDRFWTDFYEDNSPEKNREIMFEGLSAVLSSRLGQHVKDYHIQRSLTDDEKEQHLIKTPATSFDRLKTCYFYDHTYCESMDGFDYVVDQKYDVDQKHDSALGKWYRLWKSGYLEQGGYVQNSGQDLIRVDFLMPFNYPQSPMFYQEGYGKFRDIPVGGNLGGTYRYNAVVTPVLKAGGVPPYSKAFEIGAVKTYVAADITGISNSGFYVVNSDTSTTQFAKYSFYASGYTVAG